jgi:hypothetical protein
MKTATMTEKVGDDAGYYRLSPPHDGVEMVYASEAAGTAGVFPATGDNTDPLLGLLAAACGITRPVPDFFNPIVHPDETEATTIDGALASLGYTIVGTPLTPVTLAEYAKTAVGSVSWYTAADGTVLVVDENGGYGKPFTSVFRGTAVGKLPWDQLGNPLAKADGLDVPGALKAAGYAIAEPKMGVAKMLRITGGCSAIYSVDPPYRGEAEVKVFAFPDTASDRGDETTVYAVGYHDMGKGDPLFRTTDYADAQQALREMGYELAEAPAPKTATVRAEYSGFTEYDITPPYEGKNVLTACVFRGTRVYAVSDDGKIMDTPSSFAAEYDDADRAVREMGYEVVRAAVAAAA